MSSVLHLRIEAPNYSSEAIEKAFKEYGFIYNSIDWQAYRFNHGIEQLKRHVIDVASHLKPTIIFAHIQGSEVFDLNTWKELQKHGFVINYTFDVREMEDTQWMFDVAPFIGHTFFSNSSDVTWCEVNEIKNTSAIHSSCDMDLFKPIKRNQKVFDVVFCGNRYDNTNMKFPFAKQRQEMITILEKEHKDRFMSYGLGQRGGLIMPAVEANVYTYSKIAICHNNFSVIDYTSDRLWRIMSSGTFCLCQYFPGIENIFKKEVHLDWFNNFDEMNGLIKYYLDDEKERESIAEIGTNYVRENHRWIDRIKEMMSKINLHG